jgi:hypothetical protein
VTALDLLLLALAGFRISRLIIEDSILGPFRTALFVRWPGTDIKYEAKDRERVRGGTFELSGDYYASNPTETGDRLSKLLGCYACTGFWVSLGLAIGYFLSPTGTRWFSLPWAISGAVWLIAVVQDFFEKE